MASWSENTPVHSFRSLRGRRKELRALLVRGDVPFLEREELVAKDCLDALQLMRRVPAIAFLVAMSE